MQTIESVAQKGAGGKIWIHTSIETGKAGRRSYQKRGPQEVQVRRQANYTGEESISIDTVNILRESSRTMTSS